MDFSKIDGVTTTQGLANSSTVGEGGLDRHAFLKLFTTQLQNQNPQQVME